MELKILKNREVKPHYTLTLEYMLGDGIVNGITDNIHFYELDEVTKNFIIVLEKLKGKRLKHHWGWMWNQDHYDEAVKEGILTEEDIRSIKDFDDEEDPWLKEDAEISFYVYEGYKITYTDENGNVYPVEVCK